MRGFNFILSGQLTALQLHKGSRIQAGLGASTKSFSSVRC